MELHYLTKRCSCRVKFSQSINWSHTTSIFKHLLLIDNNRWQPNPSNCCIINVRLCYNIIRSMFTEQKQHIFLILYFFYFSAYPIHFTICWCSNQIRCFFVHSNFLYLSLPFPFQELFLKNILLLLAVSVMLLLT